MDGPGGTIKGLATRIIISCRTVMKDSKSLVERQLHSKYIFSLKLMSGNQIEYSLKETNASIYCNDFLGIPGTIHAHSVAPDPIGIERLLPWMAKVRLYTY